MLHAITMSLCCKKVIFSLITIIYTQSYSKIHVACYFSCQLNEAFVLTSSRYIGSSCIKDSLKVNVAIFSKKIQLASEHSGSKISLRLFWINDYFKIKPPVEFTSVQDTHPVLVSSHRRLKIQAHYFFANPLILQPLFLSNKNH